MVTPNSISAMKSTIKHIGLFALVSLTALVSCHRFNPEDEMVKTIDVPRCLKPVTVKADVLYNTVTIDLKVFPDAEKYVLELYKSAFDEETEPVSDDLIEKIVIAAKQIPYTFATLEDLTIYYRIAAINETKGKEQSLWTLGRFKTNVDPTTICLTPVPEVTECFEQVRFNWAKAETDKYLIEVYDKSIPSAGEPDPEHLLETVELTNDDIPFTTPKIAAGTYYYRVKAIDLAGERRDSKWARGSFKTEQFSWPDPANFPELQVINEPFADSYAEPARSQIKELFTGSSTSVPAGDPICWNKIYYAPEIAYMNDRMSTRGVGKYTDESEYGVVLPTEKRFIYFYITQPGEFKSFLRKQDKAGAGVTVALLTNKKGFGKRAIYVFDSTDRPTGGPSSGDPVIENITEEMLYGIVEPAQVFIFDSRKTGAVYVYPISWTPWTPEE